MRFYVMFCFDLCSVLSQLWVLITLPHSVFFHIVIVHGILLYLLRPCVVRDSTASIGRKETLPKPGKWGLKERGTSKPRSKDYETDDVDEE